MLLTKICIIMRTKIFTQTEISTIYKHAYFFEYSLNTTFQFWIRYALANGALGISVQETDIFSDGYTVSNKPKILLLGTWKTVSKEEAIQLNQSLNLGYLHLEDSEADTFFYHPDKKCLFEKNEDTSVIDVSQFS